MTQRLAVWEDLPPKMKRIVAHAKDRLQCLCGHLFLAHSSTVEEGAVFVGIGLGSCGGGPLQDSCDQACLSFQLDTRDRVPTCTRPEHGQMAPLAPRGEQERMGSWFSCRADRCTTVVLVPSPLLVQVFERRAAEQRQHSGPPVEGFYADVVRGSRTVLLAGPFTTEPAAREVLDRARQLAQDLDPFTAFDAFGTVQVQAAVLPKGKLNERLGLDL